MSSAEDIPFIAYKGGDPFIFVSYSHKDGKEVFAEIARLHRLGYRIWYDEGIEPGSEWSDEIAKAVEKAAYFIVFVSENAIRSPNVRKEINFALNLGKPFVAIHLAETKLSPGLELQMADLQAILKWRLSVEHYQRKLGAALAASTRLQNEMLAVLPPSTGESTLGSVADIRNPKPIAKTTSSLNKQTGPVKPSLNRRWLIAFGVALVAVLVGLVGSLTLISPKAGSSGKVDGSTDPRYEKQSDDIKQEGLVVLPQKFPGLQISLKRTAKELSLFLPELKGFYSAFGMYAWRITRHLSIRKDTTPLGACIR